MITLALLFIAIISFIIIVLAVAGGLSIALIDPIIAVLVIIGLVKLFKMIFRKKD